MVVSRSAFRLIAAVVVFLIAALAVTLLVLPGGGDGEDEAPSDPGAAPSDSPRRPVVVVKVDNVEQARPQAGLSAADVVYVEPVEGGLTRLAAVYASRLPEAVGPVRSARETDIALVRQFGTPVLAYSGGAPEIEPLLKRAPITLVTDKTRPEAYFRGDDRPIPHNLYVRPQRLPGQQREREPEPVTRPGAAPEGGTPVDARAVDFRDARYRFTWSGADGRWRISLDGSPLTTREAGRVTAGTVVVQRVAVREGRQVRDSGGQLSPVAGTVGRGEATILRDGKAFDGTWSRPSPEEPTTYRTRGGQRVPVAEGPVWVLLTPR
ncbi:hypothetical protein FHS23_002126 [Prauserella isguenensis]|uniref:DUF3048 domain-containing protein n=1 Tax=Prauserella isguenensis TaxID=1470180 RepID=A0A839S1B0_9PSEU|nr:DUF3048 domain-containing protein [Prauserella isguenensis]MBB3051103.1 hypothetical protein [Prauserella isguenensis]